MIAALILAAATATASPAPALTFAGVTLGESAQALFTQMGDPTSVRVDAGTTMYTFVIDRAARGSIAVFLDHNNVVEIHATRNTPASGDGGISALGVTLGAPESALSALPKAGGDGMIAGANGLLYRFDAKSGIVHRIIAGLPHAIQLGLLASPDVPVHGGASFADAIVIGATTESAGVPAEYAYFDLNACPGGGSWKTTRQSLTTNAGKPYDVLDVVCSTGGATRSFYFDISRYFGKI